ncbi:hypothetical protein E2C01_034068 [Portunus trituberculatus]|uniref:Uncharacterized protein n=1 Tax=Portunus trituberculatus TaxID=210409 RepID=A0A5B7F5U4_PORTR|nr:hypothetical protein [Portunus trituberculatus]
METHYVCFALPLAEDLNSFSPPQNVMLQKKSDLEDFCQKKTQSMTSGYKKLACVYYRKTW